jgi:cytochrome b561
MNVQRSYSPLQRTLHWIIAAGVVLMIPAGIYMVRRGVWSNFDSLTNTLYSWHKLIGFCLLGLVLLRLFVRLRRGTPPPEPIHPLLQLGANISHAALYILLVLVPLLGWTGVSAYGARGTPLGVNLPEIVPQNQELAHTILYYHGWAALLLGVIALTHIAAALMHRFVLRDGVLARMWPSAGGRSHS